MHYGWECKLAPPLWRFIKKLKIELPYDPVIALLGIYPKNTKTLIQRDTRTPTFIVVFTIAKIWEQPKGPLIDKWIKMMWNIYAMEYY